MKDAGIEAKRETQTDTPGFKLDEQLAASLGTYEATVQETLEEADRADVIRRIWNKDAALWKNEESQKKIIANSLGWLIVPTAMLEVADELRTFADSVR